VAGRTSCFSLNTWQNGLAVSVFTHTGSIHVALEFGPDVDPSAQKRDCEIVISVCGAAGLSCLRRLDLRETFGSGRGAIQAAFTDIKGTPGWSTNVGMMRSTGRPEATLSVFQKSSAAALEYANFRM
jgi:hypothetical protein